MSTAPSELRLTLAPRRRFEAIDVNGKIAREAGDLLSRHRRALYCSLHTTAGYLDQSLSARLSHNQDRLARFISSFGVVFPQGAKYRHDRMELREELSPAQKEAEPRNADSHLTFIGAGLRNCVTCTARADAPVYFIDLDGTSEAMCRRRETTILAYDDERVVANTSMTIGMSKHPIDSINLADERYGVIDHVNELLAKSGVERGRVDLSLASVERHAGLTVNEYETLLMRHDLVDVLRNPLHFARLKGRHMLDEPMRIPRKTLNYAKYDLVRVLNSLMEALGLEQSSLERLVAKVMALPARRFIRSRRVSFLAAPENGGGVARIVRGTYQSPILVQWQSTAAQERTLRISVVELSRRTRS